MKARKRLHYHDRGCEVLLPFTDRVCNRGARYIAYGTHRICRRCLERHRRGATLRFGVQFNAAQAADESWRLRKRLEADVPEVTPRSPGSTEPGWVPRCLQGRNNG